MTARSIATVGVVLRLISDAGRPIDLPELSRSAQAAPSRAGVPAQSLRPEQRPIPRPTNDAMNAAQAETKRVGTRAWQRCNPTPLPCQLAPYSVGRVGRLYVSGTATNRDQIRLIRERIARSSATDRVVG